MIDNFGKQLSDFMQEHNLTQSEVAKRSGVAQPVINRLLKTTQPEMSTIRKVASGLNVDILIADNGEVTIGLPNFPNHLEWSAYTDSLSPEQIVVTCFDTMNHKQVCKVTWFYKPGESKPYKQDFERGEWIPGYVSDFGLLRWARAYANQLLEGPRIS